MNKPPIPTHIAIMICATPVAVVAVLAVIVAKALA